MLIASLLVGKDDGTERCCDGTYSCVSRHGGQLRLVAGR